MADSFPCEMAALNSDGATCHTARTTIGQIEENEMNVWNEGSENSPGLNLIEHTWTWLLESVFNPPHPKTREQLIKRAE